MTTTQTNVSPVFDSYVDPKMIDACKLTVLQVNSTDLALEERGDDCGVIEPRILPIIGVVIMGVIVASLIVTGVVAAIVFNIEDDVPVSSNSMLLILLVLTMIWHSVVRHTLSRWSPACMLITPIPTMLCATRTLLSCSMGPRAQIGIIYITSFRYPLEGQ
jgi:hypothetical protein